MKTYQEIIVIVIQNKIVTFSFSLSLNILFQILQKVSIVSFFDYYETYDCMYYTADSDKTYIHMLRLYNKKRKLWTPLKNLIEALQEIIKDY